jgi:hypothetical protein
MNENVWKLPQPVRVLNETINVVSRNKKLFIGIAGAASIAALLYFTRKKDDVPKFNEALIKLNQVEEQAVQQMGRLQYIDNKGSAAVVLRDSTLPVWQNFQEQIASTKTFKLDHELEEKRQILMEYADLRVEQVRLLYKAFREDTNQYDKELQLVYERINIMLDKLAQ